MYVNNNYNNLDTFFKPASMAIVGASESLDSFGTRYIQALLDFGYKGRLYAVNHSGDNVLGFKIYRSVSEIQDSVDLAAICVPARFVPAALRDCLKKQVKAAIILSAGFSEFGEEGLLLEKEVKEIAESGIRVMGPNCFGTYCPEGGLTVVPGGGFPKDSGGTAMIAQSGQLSEGITGRAFGEGIRFSKMASYGNACNLNESDLLEYFTDDKDTKIFISYTEGVKDGRRFFKTARKNAGKKPIIIWKVGLTKLGGAAAASHTGSLAGGTAVWDAFFRQTHAIKAGSLEELIDTTAGFSCLPDGCGRRIALVSGGGAGTVIGADACETAGLEMPPFPPETDKQLRAVLPAVGTSLKNPLDMGTPHPPLKILRSTLEAVASCGDIDVIVIRRLFFSIKVSKIFGGSAAPSYEEQDELLQIPLDIKKKYNKPVVIILPEDLTGIENIDLEVERRKIRDYFFRVGIPVYMTEQRAFAAIANMHKFNARVNKPVLIEEDDSRKPVRGKVFSNILKTAKSTVLDEVQCKEILKEAGVSTVETKLVKSKEEAVSVGKKLGFPIVMKIISPQITHKSDIGGVKLGIKNSEDAGKAYDDIMKAVKDKAPGATIDGISVQNMAKPGTELVIGMTKDPQFGPMIMFGLGGTLVEIIKDVAFRIVPLTREDAGDLIRQVKAYRLLQGYRGQEAADITYLEDLLLKISRFIEDHPEIKEMDINPLIAGGSSAMALDARIILEDNALQDKNSANDPEIK